MPPVLVVRLTPVPPDPVEVVVPKSSVALDVLTLMPMLVGFVTVVVPMDTLPLALVRLIPVPDTVPLLVDDTVEKVIPRVVGALTRSAGAVTAFELPFEEIEPLPTLTVPPPAATPVPALVVTASDVNAIVPVLEARLT